MDGMYENKCTPFRHINRVYGGSKNMIQIIYGIIYLLLFIKEYRNLFYLRVGKWKYLLCYLPPLSSLYIYTRSENFGAGTFIQHGFATIINADHVGENCWINQQVTIGYNNSKKYGFGRPWIGDRVRVSCGAKVVGKLHVGDDTKIGANSVVVKDVPPRSTVVSSPAMLIREEDEAVYKKL